MKKIKNKIVISLTAGLLLLLSLPNCAKYEGKKLNSPQAPIHEKDNIEVAKKALTQEECKEYFGGRNLMKRGYQPVHIYVKNNTNKTIYLNPDYIELPLESASSVARKMHRNVGWKVTKYFIIGGPIWAAIEGLASSDANKTITADVNEKAVRLDKAIKIRPHGIINKVLFVAKENYSADFKLSLVEPKSNTAYEFNL
ncbi:hypothetical protein GF385_04415 [Candidatus Dependentiae bacterium]|nr:hypothetical protein [Candidatus Dependentiae bacterium]